MGNRFGVEKRKARNVHVTTNGCSENRIDAARMESFFRVNQWPVATDLKDADIILFHACGLTVEREDDSIAVLAHINEQKKPDAQVILCGCLPVINPKRTKAVHNGKIIMGEDENHLERLFEAHTPYHAITANYLLPEWRYPLSGRRMVDLIAGEKSWPDKLQKTFYELLTGRPARRKTAVAGPNTHSIKISTGCLDNCAFCGVRTRRGRVKSKSKAAIMAEFRHGLEKGFHRFAFIGTDTGAYGRDRSTDISALLHTIFENSPDIRVTLPNINPRWLNAMLPEFKRLAETKKIAMIGTSLQSGSDRILSLMNRKYRVADYIEIIHTLKGACPGIHIMSTIIAGYPGESEADFQKTVDVLQRLPLTWAHIHRYSPRPEALGCQLDNALPHDVIDQRYRFLNQMFYGKLLKRKCKVITNIRMKFGEKRYGSYT